MTQEINNLLTLLECTLINEENPSYIEVSSQNGYIYILLAKPEYKNYMLHERIQGVMGLLEFEHGDILEDYPVIVECYDLDELSDLLKFYGK